MDYQATQQQADKMPELIKRRNALNTKRNSVIFYGGWYSIDNASGRCKQAETLEQAIEQAEAANS